MGQIREGRVTMHSKMYFIAGSVFLFVGLIASEEMPDAEQDLVVKEDTSKVEDFERLSSLGPDYADYDWPARRARARGHAGRSDPCVSSDLSG